MRNKVSIQGARQMPKQPVAADASVPGEPPPSNLFYLSGLRRPLVDLCAGVAVLRELDRLGAIENAAAMGDYLKGQLERLAGRYPFMAGVRGKGPLIGADLVAD
jgi:4-aminobutyrate aminotransferase-like enzyme